MLLSQSRLKNLERYTRKFDLLRLCLTIASPAKNKFNSVYAVEKNNSSHQKKSKKVWRSNGKMQYLGAKCQIKTEISIIPTARRSKETCFESRDPRDVFIKHLELMLCCCGKHINSIVYSSLRHATVVDLTVLWLQTLLLLLGAL